MQVIKKIKNKAFTIAEVLITLGVIGVVAAIVIPTISADINKNAEVAALKKMYSTLSNGYNLYVADNSSIDSAFSGNGTNADDVNSLNALAPYFRITKNCGSATGCLYNSSIRFLGGGVFYADLDSTYNGSYAKAILEDGTLILLDEYAGTCSTDLGDGPLNNICAMFDVDINGFKGPNTRGRDYFSFWVTKTGVYPVGSYNDGYTCDINSSWYLTSDGCAAKVLQEGTMNY